MTATRPWAESRCGASPGPLWGGLAAMAATALFLRPLIIQSFERRRAGADQRPDQLECEARRFGPCLVSFPALNYGNEIIRRKGTGHAHAQALLLVPSSPSENNISNVRYNPDHNKTDRRYYDNVEKRPLH